MNKLSFVQKIISKYTNAGQFSSVLAATHAVYKKDYKGVGLLSIAVIVNQIFIEVIKRTIGGVRPNGKSKSFLSGHTAAAILPTLFLMRRYGLDATHPLVAGCFLNGIFVAIGRVFIRAHWWRDVIGGAVLGLTIGYLSGPELKNDKTSNNTHAL